MYETEAQAPICPFCFDDHSKLNGCENKDLKIQLMHNELAELKRLIVYGDHMTPDIRIQLDRLESKLNWL